MNDATIRNMAGLLGFLLLTAGVAVMYWPAAMVLAGGLLLTGAIVGSFYRKEEVGDEAD